MVLLFFFFQINPLPADVHLTSSTAQPGSRGQWGKLGRALITEGRGMLRWLDHAIKEDRCGTCAALNTTSTNEVQFRDQNPLTKSLHTWTWVNITSVHCTPWSFPVGSGAQKSCATNNPTSLWKSPGDQTHRSGTLLLPLPPWRTLLSANLMSLVLLSRWSSAVQLSLDVCYYWSPTLRCLNRASGLPPSRSCMWQGERQPQLYCVSRWPNLTEGPLLPLRYVKESVPCLLSNT